MKKITIGFSRPRSFKPVAWLIMFIEGTKFSHTYVTWKDEKLDRRKVFEAVGTGIRIIGNKHFRKSAIVTDLFEFHIPDTILLMTEQYSHDESGKPYSSKQLVGLLYCRVINRILRLFGSNHRVSNPFRDGNYSQICVEAGAYIIKDLVGVKLTGKIENYGLKDYFQLIETFGQKVSQEKIELINSKYNQ